MFYTPSSLFPRFHVSIELHGARLTATRLLLTAAVVTVVRLTLCGMPGRAAVLAADSHDRMRRQSVKRLHHTLHLSGLNVIYDVTISPDATLVAVAGAYRVTKRPKQQGNYVPAIAVWDIDTGHLKWQRRLPEFCRNLRFLRDHNVLIAAFGTKLMIWNGTTGRLLRTIKRARGDDTGSSGTGIAVSPNGRYLAVGSAISNAVRGKAVVVFDTRTWQRVRVLTGLVWGEVTSVDISDDGREIVAASYAPETGDTEIAVWNALTGQKVAGCSTADASTWFIQPPVRFAPRSHDVESGAVGGMGLLHRMGTRYRGRRLLAPIRTPGDFYPLLIHTAAPEFVIGSIRSEEVVIWAPEARRTVCKLGVVAAWKERVPLQVAASTVGKLGAYVDDDGGIHVFEILM